MALDQIRKVKINKCQHTHTRAFQTIEYLFEFILPNYRGRRACKCNYLFIIIYAITHRAYDCMRTQCHGAPNFNANI